MLAVDSDLRGKGIGTCLVGKAIRSMRAEGCEEVRACAVRFKPDQVSGRSGDRVQQQWCSSTLREPGIFSR